ncbi:Tetratricopeptide repeat protein (fragment) [Hyella patelloides LEGE 07179]|uniref:Tetratricopeptide repeat protein n=1 Tax=Hyella patelloides LEGE 07179 TaxID=945734 RepID=A0A563VWK8_9CYAN
MTDNSKTSGQLLFEELEINLDEVPFEQLSIYTAVEYFLTIEDEPPSNATNLKKVNRYLESFHHLCDVEAWEKASIILCTRSGISTNDELHYQLRVWGHYQEQIDFSRQLLGKLNSLIDVICGISLGNAYGSLGQYQRAIDYYQQALEIARDIGDREYEGHSLGNLGLAYGYEGHSLGSLGNVYSSLGKYQRAIDYYQQALEIAQDIGDRGHEGRSLGNLGLAYGSLGEYQRAIDYHQQALKIARDIGDREYEGRSLERALREKGRKALCSWCSLWLLIFLNH